MQNCYIVYWSIQYRVPNSFPRVYSFAEVDNLKRAEKLIERIREDMIKFIDLQVYSRFVYRRVNYTIVDLYIDVPICNRE